MSVDEEYLQQVMRTVSHDISSVVRAAVGFSRLIVNHYSDCLDDKALGWLVLMEQEGKKAQTQLVSLSRYARLYGDIDMESEVNLKTLCDEVVADCSNQYPQFSVCVEDLPTVMGNKELWRQYFMEMIFNSAEYSSGECRVYTKVLADKDNRISLIIEDNGIGLDSNRLDAAVRPFRVLDPESKANGMGLPIAKRIVELHSGVFSVISIPETTPGLQVCAEITPVF
ncbi:hypothetical protein AB835_12060 [Candidatus Endobugula sertula]|uniref:histidine kinase n=1 Tax=Candidatus Endobugula sertula TaxID=62101 RepID=A0A1D2QMN2_9GAMM|nr:hypothetical protein AB835_12060 [Candidatus Endobugula sertula]